MNFPRIQELHALSGYRLSIRFADDRSIIVSCKDFLSGRIFSPLLDEVNFQNVHIGEMGEYLYWSIPVPETERPEIPSDALYLRSLSPEAEHRFEELVDNGISWKQAAQEVMAQYAPASASTLRVNEPGKKEKG